MDVLSLSRWQFAITTIYHFLFVPLTLGISLFLALLETCYVKTKRPEWKQSCLGLIHFFGTIFLINFGMGVVTGIVQEFHFGMNWSEYARFMGDIFGAPLALEALSAFFLESTFLGLWVFGWKKLSPRLHCACIWIVALASNLSAFWILVANSFMQHPVGYILRHGRVEMTDFLALITNPYAVFQFTHTLFACIATSGMLLLAICAYKILQRGPARDIFRQCLMGAAIFTAAGLIGAMGSGHLQAQYVARVQPMKTAAMEALWETADPAPFTVVALIDTDKQENTFAVDLPNMLSFMVYNRPFGEIKGIKELQDLAVRQYGADNYIPAVTGLFWSFRIMLAAGGAMMLLALAAIWMQRQGKTFRWLLWLLILALPLPFIANTTGWFLTEVGRQPWIVVGLQKTMDAFSPTLAPGEVMMTLVGYTLIYLFLALAALYAAVRYIRRTPARLEDWRDA